MSLLLFCPTGQHTRRVPALRSPHGREIYQGRKIIDGRRPDSGHAPDRRRSNCFGFAHENEHCLAVTENRKGKNRCCQGTASVLRARKAPECRRPVRHSRIAARACQRVRRRSYRSSHRLSEQARSSRRRGKTGSRLGRHRTCDRRSPSEAGRQRSSANRSVH